jgi:tetratricopeptide (TPR) repeat protein
VDDGRPGLADQEGVRQRFIAVYDSFIKAVDKVFHGLAARRGMDVLAREEANIRTAVRWAVASGRLDVAVRMGRTFRIHLEMSARLRELDQWSDWLADAAAHTTFSAAVAVTERNRAWSLFRQGRAAEAVRMLDALIERLRQTTAFDAAFELATAQLYLGRIYGQAGHAEQAIPILSEAASAQERLVRQTANLSPSETIEGLLTSETPEARQRREPCYEELYNLSLTLGDLANALRAAGRLDEALSTAKQAFDISLALRHYHSAVVGLAQTAQILMEQGHFQEADARYNQVLEAARRLGDQAMEMTTLMHQGVLARTMQQYDRAVDLYKQVLRQCQDANDEAGIMRTCNLLGAVENSQGRLSEARAWYERSRQIADRRGDSQVLGEVTHNLGIVSLQEGEAAWQRGDEAIARQGFAEAERFLHESLRLKIDRQDRPGQATSHGQLSQVYLLMGKLDQAEAHAHQVREINEGLGIIRNLPIYYTTLAQIARARGDEAQVAQWESKRHKVETELARCA